MNLDPVVSISTSEITQTVMNPVNIGEFRGNSVADTCDIEDAVHIPSTECDDCEGLSQRVRDIENYLKTLTEITFSKTDANSSISGVFLGRID